MPESTDKDPLATTPNLPPLIDSLENWVRDASPSLFDELSDRLEQLDRLRPVTDSLTAYKDSCDHYNKLRSSAPASARDSLSHREELLFAYNNGARALEGVLIAFGHLGKVGTEKARAASDSLLKEITRARPVVAAGQRQHMEAVRILVNRQNEPLAPPPAGRFRERPDHGLHDSSGYMPSAQRRLQQPLKSPPDLHKPLPRTPPLQYHRRDLSETPRTLTFGIDSTLVPEHSPGSAKRRPDRPASGDELDISRKQPGLRGRGRGGI
jgi:hypothetical protein